MSCIGTWYLKGILMPSVSIDSTTALDAVNRLWKRNTYTRHAACQGASCNTRPPKPSQSTNYSPIIIRKHAEKDENAEQRTNCPA